MKRLTWGILFIFVLFTQINAYADLQVYGYVYDENDVPLENVKVSTKDNYNIFTDTTNANGWYTLGSFYEGIKPQKYTFKYEKSGYQSLTKEIDFTTVSAEYSYQLERVTLIKLPSTPTPTPTPIATSTQINIAGTWKGYLTIPEWGSDSVTAYLEQNGNNITGKALTISRRERCFRITNSILDLK
ncbi:MAG: carboxypeptidase regulatory-like domain-containing protein [Candidatus Brocadia sp.]|nr:carboxypeptidase regulatory-like domain-containing protein [Candidatus Brocadia sp.]